MLGKGKREEIGKKGKGKREEGEKGRREKGKKGKREERGKGNREEGGRGFGTREPIARNTKGLQDKFLLNFLSLAFLKSPSPPQKLKMGLNIFYQLNSEVATAAVGQYNI